jgi:hypothetical protein
MVAVKPSYLGGGDQEDCGSKPAWAKVSDILPLSPYAGHGSTCLSSQLQKNLYLGGLLSEAVPRQKK